jgi:hypothetical protein
VIDRQFATVGEIWLRKSEGQHGFRQLTSIIRLQETELYFYARVLGFTPADEIGPVEIENDSAL